MKKLLLGIAVLVSALLVGATGAQAVMWGQVDEDNEYSWVGLMVAFDEDGNPLWRCSGSLISPTVFLTAAHCTEAPADTAQIWFDVGPIGAADGYPFTGDAGGTTIPHPDYDGFATFPNTRDVGIVLLDEPYATVDGEYGELADLGTLDSLSTRRGKQNTSFTVVGYGLQSVVPVESAERTRYVGTVQFVNLRSALSDGFNLTHSGAPGKGTGGSGTCFGDSGGPVLYEGEIVAVTSFGLNSVCMGPGFAYRTDIEETQDFLAPYLAG